MHVSILRTCREIYWEAAPVLYGQDPFLIEVHDNLQPVGFVLATTQDIDTREPENVIPWKHAGMIRHLYLDVMFGDDPEDDGLDAPDSRDVPCLTDSVHGGVLDTIKLLKPGHFKTLIVNFFDSITLTSMDPFGNDNNDNYHKYHE